MTVAIEAAANESANVRRSATRKKNAAAKKAAKPAKPAKVVGVHVLPNGRYEVSVFLGSFIKIEDAIAAREQAGLAGVAEGRTGSGTEEEGQGQLTPLAYRLAINPASAPGFLLVCVPKTLFAI